MPEDKVNGVNNIMIIGNKPQLIQYGGFKFPAKMELRHVAILWLVMSARAGNKEATDLLNLWKLAIVDAEGKQIWPMLLEVKTT